MQGSLGGAAYTASTSGTRGFRDRSQQFGLPLQLVGQRQPLADQRSVPVGRWRTGRDAALVGAPQLIGLVHQREVAVGADQRHLLVIDGATGWARIGRRVVASAPITR